MSAVPNVAAVPPPGAARPVPLPRGRRGTELAMLCFAVAIMAVRLSAARASG